MSISNLVSLFATSERSIDRSACVNPKTGCFTRQKRASCCRARWQKCAMCITSARLCSLQAHTFSNASNVLSLSFLSPPRYGMLCHCQLTMDWMGVRARATVSVPGPPSLGSLACGGHLFSLRNRRIGLQPTGEKALHSISKSTTIRFARLNFTAHWRRSRRRSCGDVYV